MARSLHDRIAEARQVLVRAGLTPEDAAFDAEVLARHVLGWDRATLLTRARESPAPDFESGFDALVRRRAAREPVALIVGHREFWGLDFEVTRDVLVPRPETELVVEASLRSIDRQACRRVADICTGSGCLAVALAHELPAARLVATDISPAALVVARRNAARHGVSPRTFLLRSNLLDALRGPFDLIVSNPPYVPSGANLPPEVSDYEPVSALFAGHDGLAVLKTLIPAATSRVAAGGAFVVEFGFGQADDVRALAGAAGWRTILLEQDLQGIPRVAVMTLGAERC